LAGERTYDLSNTFFNPNGFLSMAEAHETIDRRSSIFSRRLKIDKRRILEYAFAYGCLSACWCLEDGQEEESTLRIARSVRQFLRGLDT
jgi:streptomycin 6-kinase